MNNVPLPFVCSKLRDLESRLKKVSEIKRIVELNHILFDPEDILAVNKAFSKAQNNLENQAKMMDMPPSIAYAATFAEQVNSRLPTLQEIRSVEDDTGLAEYFEAKQKRLAFQAEEMLRLSIKENVGSIQSSSQ